MNIFAKNAPNAEKNIKPNNHNPLRKPKEKLNGFEVDPTLKWLKAEITEINQNFLILKTKKNKNIQINK